MRKTVALEPGDVSSVWQGRVLDGELSLNNQQQIDRAFDLIQKGDLLGAKAICLFLGKSHEAIIDAQFLLGVIAYKENRFKKAYPF